MRRTTGKSAVAGTEAAICASGWASRARRGFISTPISAGIPGFAAGGQLLRILIEPQDPSVDGAVALATAIEAALGQYEFTAPRLHHGYGVATWHVLRAAVALGRDIRVGLEDTVVLADGTAAASNAELVAAAVGLIEAEAEAEA